MLQAVTLGVAVVVVLLLAVAGIAGGWSGLWEIGSEHGRWTMFHLRARIRWPRRTSRRQNSVYTAIAFSLFMYLPGYAVAQNMIQRYVCTGGLRQARGVVVLSALDQCRTGVPVPAGGRRPVRLLRASRADSGCPHLESEDQILPHFVSTAGRGYRTGRPDAGRSVRGGDEYRRQRDQRRRFGGRLRLARRQGPVARASRLLTVVLGVLVIVAALAAPLLGKNVIDIIMTDRRHACWAA